MKKQILVVAFLTTLAACGDNHYQQPAPVAAQPQVVAPAPVQASPTPVIINQAPAASSGGNDALMGAVAGGALGYMAGRASQPSAPSYVDRRPVYVDRRPVIVNKTVVVKQYNAPKTVNVVQRTAPAKTMSLTKTSSGKSSFGGFAKRK